MDATGQVPQRGVAPLAGSVDRNVLILSLRLFVGLSLPSRGAWIEIQQQNRGKNLPVSLPSRGAWIEIVENWYLMTNKDGSLPSRGAWIEIGRLTL